MPNQCTNNNNNKQHQQQTTTTTATTTITTTTPPPLLPYANARNNKNSIKVNCGSFFHNCAACVLTAPNSACSGPLYDLDRHVFAKPLPDLTMSQAAVRLSAFGNCSIGRGQKPLRRVTVTHEGRCRQGGQQPSARRMSMLSTNGNLQERAHREFRCLRCSPNYNRSRPISWK